MRSTIPEDPTTINLVDRYKPLGIMAVRAATEIKAESLSRSNDRLPGSQNVPQVLLDLNQGSD